MINLLPRDYSSAIHYGRLNARLRWWLIASLVATAGLILVMAIGWVYISQQSKNLNKSITASKAQLASQNLASVQKQADEITKNVRLINQVLGREIRFSDLIQNIGTVMPPGTILNSLTLSKVNGALDLSANTRDYASAAQIAVNLSDPKNNIFDKLDIVTVNCSTVGAYPCNATFKALFNKDVPSRFLNVAKGVSQ